MFLGSGGRFTTRPLQEVARRHRVLGVVESRPRRAYYHGDATGGWTVHRLDEGEDTGPLLAQWEFAVPRGITAPALMDEVLPTGAGLLADALEAWEAGTARETPQPEAPGEPRARGVARDEPLVDWAGWPGERVWHFLRGASLWDDALPPLPGAVREWGRFQPGDPGREPGRAGRDREGRYVACRDGRLYYHLRPVPAEILRMGAAVGVGAAALAWGL